MHEHTHHTHKYTHIHIHTGITQTMNLSSPTVPFNAPGVESGVTKELDLLKVVLSLVVGCYIWVNPQEGVVSSGATLLRTYHQQRRKTRTVLIRRPNLPINARGLKESVQQRGRGEGEYVCVCKKERERENKLNLYNIMQTFF